MIPQKPYIVYTEYSKKRCRIPRNLPRMKITLIGNCQTKALTWYIQQLDSDFDVKYIWTDIGMKNFSKHNNFEGRPTPTIINKKRAKSRLTDSDYIIYQPIRPSRIKEFNYEDIQKYGDNAKLISMGCFYCVNIGTKKMADQEEYQKKTGLLGMKQRAGKFKLDIQPHKIIEKHGIGSVSTDNAYHPKALYFLELVREICAKTGWDYYSDEQYNRYFKEGFPFG